MDNIVREALKTKIVGLKGTAFQDALDRIYSCIYGQCGYQRVKQKHDKGSDGIINGNVVLAAYAPEKYDLRDFKKKIKCDFCSYACNWEATHNSWQVVTNLESTANMIKFVDELKSGTKIICIEMLLQIISDQTWTVKIGIFRALDIPERFWSHDVIETVVEDLIKISERNVNFPLYERPAYIADKITLNVNEENHSAFIEEYEEYLPVFPIISSVVGSRTQESISAIRNKVRSTYISLSGSFEYRLSKLVEMMAQGKSQDDYYVYYMRIVMLYFFEQCLYGNKPSTEVGGD